MDMVFRGPNGSAHMLGAQHSQSYEAMLTNVPGLKVVSCATPYDGKGLLKAAIQDPNPIIFLESEMLYGMKGEVPEGEYIIPLGVGDIKREGKDVTIIAWDQMLHLVMKAADELAKKGVDVEVLDPRTLQPLDEELIFKSVSKTHRLLIVESSWSFASVGAQISDRVQKECFDELDAPIERVNTKFVHFPYNEAQEEFIKPSVDEVVESVNRLLYRN